jgi:hypothetical protein
MACCIAFRNNPIPHCSTKRPTCRNSTFVPPSCGGAFYCFKEREIIINYESYLMMIWSHNQIAYFDKKKEKPK